MEATFKVELFVIITKSSTLDVAAVLDPPLLTSQKTDYVTSYQENKKGLKISQLIWSCKIGCSKGGSGKES